MSQLLDFYRGTAADSEGRMLVEYWRWNHDTMEYHHDFIQWMFPLDEPSSVNADAPLVSFEDRVAFRGEPALQESMRRSLGQFLDFLGLEVRPDGSVARSANFPRRISVWDRSNHNWLRITRMLKSLRLLGLGKEAGEVWKCLKHLHEADGFVLESSFRYWREAAEALG